MSVHRTLTRNLACLIVARTSLTGIFRPAGACRISAAIGVKSAQWMLYNDWRGDSLISPMLCIILHPLIPVVGDWLLPPFR